MSESKIHPKEKNSSMNNPGMLQPSRVSNPDEIKIEIDPAIFEIYDTVPFANQTLQEATAMKNFKSCCGGLPKILCLPLAWLGYGPTKIVPQGFIGVKLAYGEYIEKLLPGLHEYNTLTENIILVNLRTQILQTEPQVLMTRDNVTINIDCFGFYKIIHPEKALAFLEDIEQTLKCFILGAVKSAVSQKTLDQLLYNRADIEEILQSYVSERCERFGVRILDIDVEEIKLPTSLSNEMGQIAQELLDSQGSVIRNRGKLNVAKVHLATTKELEKNVLATQLSYMSVMKEVATEKPTTLVLPLQLPKRVK